MIKTKEQEIENPATQLDLLIRKFDIMLGETGVTQLDHLVQVSKKDDNPTVFDHFNNALEKMSFVKLQNKYPQALDLVAEIIANIDEEQYFNHLELPSLPEVGHDKKGNLKEFIKYVAAVRKAIKPLLDDETGSTNRNEFLSAIDKKKKKLDKGFFYEFTDGDLKRIQSIINELREQIGASDLFEEDHRQRLLKRLEALQSEMHKKMSDIDRIWGLVGDAGVAIGKFGKDAKPFVSRIKELSQIAWKTQARAEELPSNSGNPLLESDSEE